MKTSVALWSIAALVALLGFCAVVASNHWPNVDRRIAVLDAQNIQLSIDVQKLANRADDLSKTISEFNAQLNKMAADMSQLNAGLNTIIQTQQEDRAAHWQQYQRQNNVMRHFHHHHPSQGEFK